MTDIQQPTLFDELDAEESARAVVLNFIKAAHVRRVMFFRECGLIFWRRQAAQFGEAADWTANYTQERIGRMMQKAAEQLQELGGMGAVW